MFPALYHAHHSRYGDDLPFWHQMAGDAARRVLELGCGTGRLLIPLAQAGHAVVGLDLDPEMLAFARSILPPELCSHIHLIQADMAHFRLQRRFEAILLPCNTLSTLAPQARQATFSNVRRHLSRSGIFVASLPNPQVLVRLPRHGDEEVEDVFTLPQAENPVQVSSAWVRSVKFLTVTWHYDQLYPDGRIERYSVSVQHSLAPVETYLQELDQAGLEVASVLGGFDGSAYTTDSEYLILVAALSPEALSQDADRL